MIALVHIHSVTAWTHLPAENAEHQVEHKETSNHDERNEEHPVEGTSDCIVGLETLKKQDFR